MTSDTNLPPTSAVRLSTFAYAPLDPSSHSDLEQGKREHDTRVSIEDEGDDDGGGGVEEELVWNSQLEHQRKIRKRGFWWRQIGLFVVGAVVGACLLSIASRIFDTNERISSTTPTKSSDSSSSSTDDNFDFIANPPVRIHYREDPELNSRSPLLPPSKCPIPVVYTTDEDSADIVVFNSDSHAVLEADEMREARRTKPWQKLAIWGVESASNREMLERHFDKLREGKRNETYDYEMTYRLNSTVPATYSYSYFNYANTPVPYSEKRQDKIAASFISNCRPKNARTRILDELTKLLPGKIDNFGSCHNNANADDTLREIGHYEDVGNHNNWNTKITMINYYKFSVAFENSNDYDYVTEKYFQSLERGSVPLVFGAPNYRERFFPSPNAAIDVADYLPLNYTLPSRSDDKQPEELSEEALAGLQKLADRLEYLSSEEGREEYESMLDWKKSDDWKEDNNPLGKIVKLATSEFEQDCKLAKVFRGGGKEIVNIER
ncbi:uncharacterized protein JCM6883_001989 [Sporobolomyces salmoneus]|uniref:uncharacterized protein n=1 Tax=Sporobolomyces salmoneus TaxID=183962 RepID=UPI0031755BAE